MTNPENAIAPTKSAKAPKPAPESTSESAIQLHQPGVKAERVESFREGGADHPIMAASREIIATFYMAGERPVVSSELEITDYFVSMGNKRPVASNLIDNAPVLMGFLD
ncbi:MAG: hypothetical protein SFT94_01940 [Pseudanabaenaceae cyanobacterium bins.68]|nr:hypothetical protein [Pseudanabaenaceae cyanobacterium bins.68]